MDKEFTMFAGTLAALIMGGLLGAICGMVIGWASRKPNGVSTYSKSGAWLGAIFSILGYFIGTVFGGENGGYIGAVVGYALSAVLNIVISII